MAGMVDKDYRIVAMSYNVCFGCMFSNEKSIQNSTTNTLSQHCVDEAIKQNKNVCLGNIQLVFENAKIDFGSLDLVGIQESTNWIEIIKTPALNNLSYIHHKAKFEDMVSLYNSDIFNLDAFIVGNISISEGRPYQILFLTHKLSNKKYIFINIHNSHVSTPKTLANSLSQSTQAFVVNPNPNSQKSFKDCEKTIKDTIDYIDTISKNKYDIIFMGDTNFHNEHNIWDKTLNFTPLKQINVSVSSCGKKPPNTCCVGSNKLRTSIDEDTMYGDYILISKNLKYEINNKIPTFTYDATSFPTSDHLPIVSVIKLPSLQEQVFNVNDHKILRLQNDISDPKPNQYIKNNPFRGQLVDNSMMLVYPNGKITNNNLVFVQAKNDPNKIGYVNFDYLEKSKDNEYKLKNTLSKTLRLQNYKNDPNNPNESNLYPFKGMTINNIDRLCFPNGNITDIGLVIVQNEIDPNIIGYIQHKYLKHVINGGRIRTRKSIKQNKTNNKKKKTKKSYDIKTKKKFLYNRHVLK